MSYLDSTNSNAALNTATSSLLTVKSMSAEQAIRVGIIEDNNFLLAAYTGFLSEYPDISIVFTHPSIETFEQSPAPRPDADVVLLDIGLPGKSGLDGISIIKKLLPSSKILLNSGLEDKETIMRGLTLGADGYIVKSAEPANIYRSINDVFKTGAALSAKAARQLIRQLNSNPYEEWKSTMTKKEYEVLLLLKDGLTYKEIASILGITTFTVNQHTKAIYKKFDVHSRGELVSKISQQHLPPAE
jgi:DNA-binding NarL/FixJ family response regulator